MTDAAARVHRGSRERSGVAGRGACAVRLPRFRYGTEVNMKARLLACAVVGLASAFPVGAGAQVTGTDAGRTHRARPFASGQPAYAVGARYALPPDQIAANARAAGLEPVSRPVLRGAVYYMRAVNSARTEMRVAIDARSGRVLSAARVAHEPPKPAAGEPGPELRQEAAPLPPAGLPLEGRAMPSGPAPAAPAAKPAESAPSPAPAKPVMVPIAPLE